MHHLDFIKKVKGCVFLIKISLLLEGEKNQLAEYITEGKFSELGFARGPFQNLL